MFIDEHVRLTEEFAADESLNGLRLRLATDDDAQDLFGLLALCFAEYPGCYVDPHGDLVDLLLTVGSWITSARSQVANGAICDLQVGHKTFPSCAGARCVDDPTVQESHALRMLSMGLDDGGIQAGRPSDSGSGWRRLRQRRSPLETIYKYVKSARGERLLTLQPLCASSGHSPCAGKQRNRQVN